MSVPNKTLVGLKLPDLLKLAELNPELIEQFLVALNSGFWEEWDCDLLTGVTVHGFGPDEIKIAAAVSPKEVNVARREDREGGLPDGQQTYKVVCTFTTKNSGPHQDSTKAEQRQVLVGLIDNLITGDLHREQLPWVLEVEVG